MFARFINGWAGKVVNRKVVRYLLMFFVVWSGASSAEIFDSYGNYVGGGIQDSFNAGADYAGTADLPNKSGWMGWLKDDVRIRDISIPGTHDSGARYGITGYSRNQTLTIPQQLNAGIRYLDVRLRHIDNTFAIHHGEVFQKMMFADVLRDTAAFLKANPTEFVFMRVKEEHKSQNVTRSFDETFEYYRKLYAGVIWKPNNYNPALSDVRGRIVFIQDFSGYRFPPVGLALWGFNVQDDWDVSPFKIGDKSYLVNTTIDEALVSKSNVINNLAISAPPLTPRDTAGGLNYRTLMYLVKHVLPKPLDRRYVGILSMDYPGPGIIEAIIYANNVSCSTVFLDAKTRQLATCFGNGLPSLTYAGAYSAKCDGTEQRTRDGVACYVTNTNTLKPVRLELQPTCSTLASKDGRYLSCDNAFAQTHIAPVIACNGFFNVQSGLCTDVKTRQAKPLDFSCYDTPVNLPVGTASYGCKKPVNIAPPRPSASFGSFIRPGSAIAR